MASIVHDLGDHLSLLNIMSYFLLERERSREADWARKCKLRGRSLLAIEKDFEELKRLWKCKCLP